MTMRATRDAIWTTGVPGRDAPYPDDVPEPQADVQADLGIDLDDPVTALVLALADDDLLAGHRASHWTGVAPSLEEDIAFSGIAQDEINHADVWYQLLVSRGGQGDRDAVDLLGLGRRPEQYRHAVLCERPPGDFVTTIARHWLYDHADAVRLSALVDSSDPEVAALANKLVHEERYHLEHADTWFTRLAGGGEEARSSLHEALAELFPEAVWLFEPTPGEAEVVAGGILPVPSRELLARWLDVVGAMLEEAGLADVMAPFERDDGGWQVEAGLLAEPGGRHGVHTDDFIEDAWKEMTAMHRAHPGARW
jgi:ring-1,2-phenylacetyl-CoA epoxidase subunit PaaC